MSASELCREILVSLLIMMMMILVQNTTSRDGQIKQLVYSMENAILNLPADQEQMVWFIDFKGWSMGKSMPVKTVQEVAYVLQNHYPERLGMAILLNPPHIFETFWLVSVHAVLPHQHNLPHNVNALI